MINLIPSEQKKKMNADFLVRLGIISLYVLGFSIFAGVAALLPSYFHVMVKSSVADKNLAVQKETPAPSIEAEVTAQINDLNKRLTLIESARDKSFIVTDRVIRELINNKMPDIKITDISYDGTTKEKTIKVSGEAPSRERLLLFRIALEHDAQFQKVDLPISNFVRGSNIRFFLTLIPS